MIQLRILDSNNDVVNYMEFDTLRQAEKAEAGVRINLDHASYYTEIVSSNE